MSNVTTLQAAPQQAMADLPMVATSSAALVLDPSSMDAMLRLADVMATGKVTIPPEYRNSPGDCLAVVMQAVQWRMNPFAVAQKTHFVSGKIGYEAQLVNAVVTSLAPTKDRLHFEWFGDWTKVIGKFEIKRGDKGEYRVPGWKLADEEGLGVRVWATLKGEDEPRVLELLLAQARTRNSTLWADDPRQQLAYLGVKRWSRLYVPDVILGVYTPDELDEADPIDIGSGSTQAEPAPKSNAERLRERATERGGKKPDPKPEPRSDLIVAVLRAIDRASTMDDLTSALDLARELPDGAEKDEARAAYAEKQRALKATADAQPVPAATRAPMPEPDDLDVE